MNNNNNISNEDEDLNGIAPKLSNLGKNDPFGSSKNYFDDFNARLQNSIDDLEEIKEFAPTLLNIPKYNPFETPAGYFDHLPSLVQEKAVARHTSVTPLEWLLLLIKPRFIIPVAATMIIAIAAINYLNKNSEPIHHNDAEELSLEEQLYYIDEAVIIEQYTADAGADIENISSEDNSIEDYLIENNIEETDL